MSLPHGGRSAQVYTNKSDVWSFGVTLWEIYSYGRVPYPRMSMEETVRRITEGYRLERPDECPDAVYSIMLSCWHADPEQRPTFASLKAKLR